MLRKSRSFNCVHRHISPERYHLTRAGQVGEGATPSLDADQEVNLPDENVKGKIHALRPVPLVAKEFVICTTAEPLNQPCCQG